MNSWLSTSKIHQSLNSDNHTSLSISSKLVELETNLLEKKIDSEIEVQNKTSSVKILSSPIKPTNDNNDIQSLSKPIFESEFTPPNLLLESSCEIKLSENFDIEDPVTWPLISDKFRICIVEHGPKLENYKNYNFPIDTSRHFHEKWLFRTLPNGEEVRRPWLLYSKQKNVLFCFSCVLFSTEKNQYFSSISLGFNNWKKLNPKISEHEKSTSHRECVFKWKEFEKRLLGGKTIDCTLQNAITSEKKKVERYFKNFI